MHVTISPDSDGGDPEVPGTVHAISRDTIAILSEDEFLELIGESV